MTVKELIEQLEKIRDKDQYVMDEDGNMFMAVSQDEYAVILS